MAILNILEFPDPRLRTIAKAVEQVDDELRQLIDDMFATMYDAPGIGLAATQVNVHKRLVVMDLSEDKNEPLVFINPEFEPLTDEVEQYQEGCLSVPGFYENVDRPQKVKIKALDRDGQPYGTAYKAAGLTTFKQGAAQVQDRGGLGSPTGFGRFTAANVFGLTTFSFQPSLERTAYESWTTEPVNNAQFTAALGRALPNLAEVSIGHAVIADALTFGMAETVRLFRHAIDDL